MPKRKKQNQQQQLHQQPPLPERDETGDEEDGSPIGPPSLLGPPPMANGKPGDPKSAPHYNKNVESTSMSTTSRMAKSVVHTCNGILHCSENEGTPDTSNLNESHKHHVEPKDPDRKECRLYDFLYTEFED